MKQNDADGQTAALKPNPVMHPMCVIMKQEWWVHLNKASTVSSMKLQALLPIIKLAQKPGGEWN